ncbi:unnamed protein product [Urochloa humidicola]
MRGVVVAAGGGDRVQHRTGVGCRQLGSLRPGTAGGQGGRPRLGAANGRSGKAVGSVARARCHGDLDLTAAARSAMGQAGRWQERVVATSSPARLLAGHHTQRGGVRMRCSPIKAQIHQCPAWLKCVAHHVFVILPRSWLSSGKKR